MAKNEGRILPLPPQAAMTESPHIAVESPGEGKLRQIGFAQAVDDVVSLRGADYAETILPDQTGHAGMVLQTDGTTADWAYIQTIRVYAKNNSGSTMTRGQAVYVNGSSGTNILITKAQADTDPTSSKTIGLVEDASVAVNGFCWVVTEGMLSNANTAAYSAGNALWLSPTTAGSITATKPAAPNHIVFIGYVVRANANNGEIYVKPQNGFELDELHDVAIASTPSDGQVLTYEAATSLWKPKTPTTGTVTSVAATGSNGINVSGSPIIGAGTLAFSLGAITPTSVAATGTVTGSNLSGTNTGDQNLSAYVTGPASAVPNRIAVFNGTTGKIIADSGMTIPATSGAASNVLITDGSGVLSWQDRSRFIATVTSDTTMGSAAFRDYVYFVANQCWITFPTAVGNTNQYTIKNRYTAPIIPLTTSNQTIDGRSQVIGSSNNALVIYPNESYDFFSDGSNWYTV